MIKEAVGLGTQQQDCSLLILPCAWPFVESSPLEDAKASNLSQSETQSHSVSKKRLDVSQTIHLLKIILD